MGMVSMRPSRARFLQSDQPFIFWLAVIILWLAFAVQYRWGPEGVDYKYYFHSASMRWVHGEDVYAAPYFNPPWMLYIVTPLIELMGYWEAQAAIIMITVAALIRAWYKFTPVYDSYAAPLGLAFILLNLHLFDLFLRIQIDGFILLGILLIYSGLEYYKPYRLGLGWVLAFFRPTSIILLLPYALWLAYRQRILWRSMILPMAIFASSFIFFGQNWMQSAYAQFLGADRERAPQDFTVWHTTLWRIAQYYNLTPFIPLAITLVFLIITLMALRRSLEMNFAFAFLSAASLIVTPYALSYHYSILLALFIPPLLCWRLWLFLPLYLLTLTPIVRVFWGPESAWIDIVFPLTVWSIFLYRIFVKPSELLSNTAPQREVGTAHPESVSKSYPANPDHTR